MKVEKKATHEYKRYSSKDGYPLFKKDNDHIVIKRTKYHEICQDFNELLLNKIIKEGFNYKIPFGLGQMRMYRNGYRDEALMAHIRAMSNNPRPSFRVRWEKPPKNSRHLLNMKLFSFKTSYHLREKIKEGIEQDNIKPYI